MKQDAKKEYSKDGVGFRRLSSTVKFKQKAGVGRRGKRKGRKGPPKVQAKASSEWEPIMLDRRKILSRKQEARTRWRIPKGKGERERPDVEEERPRERRRPCAKRKGACNYPLIHLDRGADAWYLHWEVTENGGMQNIYVTNKGLRTSPLVVVETYEVEMWLYGIPVGDPYGSSLNARGYIRSLHPGETKMIELEWRPNTGQDSTHLMVMAYDPVLDPPYPLNYHPSLFPDFHIKHNGHAVVRN